MLEIITTFASQKGLRQSGEVRGRYYTRTGACNTCGKCCNNIYLIHDEKTIESVEEFATLQAENPDYQYFIPVDETEHGIRFKCVHLTDENRCAIYTDRPDFCRLYPSEKSILLGGQLAEGCGYSFQPLQRFAEVLRQNQDKKHLNAGKLLND